MTTEQLFSLFNALALAGWLLLIFLPRWRWTFRVVHTGALSLVLALAYLVLIAISLPESEGGFGSLAEVRALFSSDYALMAGWIHYLAFDLFVGSWIARNARQLSISHWVVIPCLLFTFMFGPVGLLLYVIFRGFFRNAILNSMSYETN
jgi:hypothetical protein